MLSTAPLRERSASQIRTIAAGALIDHIQTHGLGFPTEIVSNSLLGGTPAPLRVYLTETDHAAWVRTVHVDDRRAQPSGQPGFAWVTWDVRLPDTGTRVELLCLRPLALTPTGVAREVVPA